MGAKASISSIPCPQCGGGPLRVTDTRFRRELLCIHRRRVCEQCGSRFSTREDIPRNAYVMPDDVLQVVGR